MVRVLLSTSRWGKTEKLLFDAQFRNNLSLYITVSTHSIKKKDILKNTVINVFILEIECLDIFHDWWKEKMIVISIGNFYNVSMTRDFPQYLHQSTSSKGNVYRLGVHPEHHLEDLFSRVLLHVHVTQITLGLQKRWLSDCYLNQHKAPLSTTFC